MLPTSTARVACAGATRYPTVVIMRHSREQINRRTIRRTQRVRVRRSFGVQRSTRSDVVLGKTRRWNEPDQAFNRPGTVRPGDEPTAKAAERAGRVLVHQLVPHDNEVFIIDNNETAFFDLYEELNQKGFKVDGRVGDIRHSGPYHTPASYRK